MPGWLVSLSGFSFWFLFLISISDFYFFFYFLFLFRVSIPIFISFSVSQVLVFLPISSELKDQKSMHIYIFIAGLISHCRLASG